MGVERAKFELEVSAVKGDTSAIPAVAAEVKHLGEAAHEAGLSHKEVHEGIELVSESAAGALGPIGELVRFMSNPEMLAAQGIVIGMTLLNEQFEQTIKLQAKMEDGLRAIKEATREAATSAAEHAAQEKGAFEQRIKHLDDERNLFNEAMQERLKLYGTEQDHIKGMIDIEAQRFDAYIAYLVKIGAMTPEEGKRQTEAHAQGAKDAKEAADERKAQADIDAKKAELDKAVVTGMDASADLLAARPRSQQAHEAADKFKNETELQKSTLDEMEAAAKEAEQRVLEINRVNSILSNVNSSPEEVLGAVGAAAKIGVSQAARHSSDAGDMADARSLRAAADTARTNYLSRTKTQGILDRNAADADNDVKKFEDLIADANKALESLPTAIDNAVEELNRRKADYSTQRAEEGRDREAADFYARGPQDKEADDLFRQGTPRAPSVGDPFALLTGEVNKQLDAASMHYGYDESKAEAAIQHIQALFASHMAMTGAQTDKMLKLEQALEAVIQQYKASRGNNP